MAKAVAEEASEAAVVGTAAAEVPTAAMVAVVAVALEGAAVGDVVASEVVAAVEAAAVALAAAGAAAAAVAAAAVVVAGVAVAAVAAKASGEAVAASGKVATVHDLSFPCFASNLWVTTNRMPLDAICSEVAQQKRSFSSGAGACLLSHDPLSSLKVSAQTFNSRSDLESQLSRVFRMCRHMGLVVTEYLFVSNCPRLVSAF